MASARRIRPSVRAWAAASTGALAPGSDLLEVGDLRARIASNDQAVLRGVNLRVRCGEVHAIMGKNGSGKSTLSKVLVGHPDYEVSAGTVTYKGQSLLDLGPEERAREGLFLSFQSPIEVPGVSNIDFLRVATNARRKARGEKELDPLEFYAFVMPKLSSLRMDAAFLDRSVNEGFSGGERKRNEILQLACLDADCAILDEIDSGLDVDALRDVAGAVNALRRERPAMGIVLVTHYQRLLDYIQPDHVHIMKDGRIVKSGDMSLVHQLESSGYGLLAGHSPGQAS
ncbi:hypothetical protein H632_c3308p0 [Helicosporidium sp. ATCC 50920]|nr:hypothetical protein H632_c3308p0 [Helicosporidium sp. ATCC 50920]|eukprot:KDD72463.1 hypothetical protein H632_c3308p0 [Helicosporidium sp. ATCC 50920]